jgi:hypothetical protein
MEEGKKALNTLYDERTALEEKLAAIHEQIIDVEKTLGIGPRKAKRIRIRPSIVEVLTANKAKRVPMETLVETVKAQIDSVEVSDDAIAQAAIRLAKDDESVTITEKGIMLK